MSCHSHDTSTGDGGISDDAKLHNYLQLANDEGEKLFRNDENGRTAELYEKDDEDENDYPKTEKTKWILLFSM